MKKLMLFGIIGLFVMMVFVSGVVSAAAPTSPSTLSPDNNSIWFNDTTLTCSGSTDPESDNINYSFYINDFLVQNSNSINYITFLSNAIWVEDDDGGTCSFTYGNSESNPYIIKSIISGPQCYLELEDSLFFRSNNWTVYLESPDAMAKRIYIDGNQVWSSGTSFGGYNQTIDVSAYNDGQYHTIKFWTDTDNTNQQFKFYFSGLSGEVIDWYCQACDNNSECSNVTETRTLTKMLFEECSMGNVALNFTVKDEESGDVLDNINFDAAWLLESAWDSLLYNFGLSGESNYEFCLSPSGNDVNITGFVEYDSTNSSYSFPRQYYFQNALINGNSILDIDLFQLSDTFATPVTFTAVRGASTVEDVLIHVQRYDPGTGTYTLVAMGETGASGQDIIYLRLTDAWYRILAYDGGELAYTGDPEHILDSSYTILLTGGEGGMSDYWDNWNALSTINYNLAFNESGTNSFTLTADDGSGAATSMCLKVEKWSMLDGMDEVYYECESSASVTMSYEITDLDATYHAKFIAFFDGGWRLIDSEEVSLSLNLSDMIGMDGIIFALLLIGIIAFIGLWNPIASVALTMFGLIISFMIGLINVPWAALIGILIAGGIILFKIKE